MSASTKSLKLQFDLQTRLFNNTLDGLSDAETNTQISGNANNMKFIAGHLLNTRANFLTQLTGGQPDTTYTPLFGRGVKFDAQAAYPSISEISTKWREISDTISNKIAAFPQHVLEAKAPVQTPVADETLHGLLSFLMSHEAYHIGQLGLLRKMLGKEPMAYN